MRIHVQLSNTNFLGKLLILVNEIKRNIGNYSQNTIKPQIQSKSKQLVHSLVDHVLSHLGDQRWPVLGMTSNMEQSRQDIEQHTVF